MFIIFSYTLVIVNLMTELAGSRIIPLSCYLNIYLFIDVYQLFQSQKQNINMHAEDFDKLDLKQVRLLAF